MMMMMMMMTAMMTMMMTMMNDDDNDGDDEDDNNLRELFYDRNPGDARVKVGSERQAERSPGTPELR